MRRMSFSATVEQMQNRTKTVTRRDATTWGTLKSGDRLLAVEKAMGLAKGERQVPIGVIEIISNNIEPLAAVDEDEARREGFDSLAEFIKVWTILNKGWYPDRLVRRIRFRHIEKAEPGS